MSKIKRLKKRFTAFVNQLTPDQVREQLVLAYLQMEKCQAVLKGYDVEPVEMMDNGESSDLELFYLCKKVAEELAYLNQMAHDGKKVGPIELEVKVDTRNLQNELDKIKIRDYIKPTGFHLESFLRFKKGLSKISESLRMPKFGKGQEVWYMFGDRVQHSTIDGIACSADGEPLYRTAFGHETIESETFPSLEELIDYLNDTIHGEDD